MVGSGTSSWEGVRQAGEVARVQWKGVGDMDGSGLFVHHGCDWAEKFCEILEWKESGRTLRSSVVRLGGFMGSGDRCR